MITATIPFKKINFPVGEPHITIQSDIVRQVIDVEFEFEKAEEIVDLALLADAVKRDGRKLGMLTMPYVPFGRQDRAANPGEAFSLKWFCGLINSLNFETVLITDPHSEVTTALLDRAVVVNQYSLFEDFLAERGKNFWLVSPDAGALKKVYKLATKCEPVGVIECSKQRDTKTGALAGAIVHARDLDGLECFIVDDICDGGGTFINIAKELKKKNAGPITLMVSHGFFTRGLGVFDGLIDQIITSKGIVK